MNVSSTKLPVVFFISFSIFVSCLCELPAASAAECAGKTVAQCADALATKVENLKSENLKLSQDIVAQNKKLDELAAAFNTFKAATEQRLDLLDRKSAAVYQALSFGNGAITRKNGAVYNGADDGGPVSPKCASGSVMTGVRHSGYNYENGEIDCVSLRPADVH
jgi:hypothetical protein